MSQHPSFGGSTSTKRQRCVLKRYEKLEELSKKELWTEESGIYGLPKVKVVKIKAKKDKPKAAESDDSKSKTDSDSKASK